MKYLRFLVCGSHHFIVALIFLYSMNDPSCVLSYNFLGDEVMGYISHPKVLSSWIRGFFHTIQSEVIYRLMCYEACIYRLLLISMMQSIFVFMFITVNKTWYNHSVNAYVVSFIIYICPGCINTSIFHGDSEVINKKVGNRCWVFQGSMFVNSHTFSWVLFILKYC